MCERDDDLQRKGEEHVLVERQCEPQITDGGNIILSIEILCQDTKADFFGIWHSILLKYLQF